MKIDSTIHLKALIFLLRILRFPRMRILGGPLKGLKWLTQTNYKFLIGNYEPPTVRSIEKFVSGVPDLIFFDVGANVGHHRNQSDSPDPENDFVDRLGH